MKKNFTILVAVLSIGMAGCSGLIKNAINKKFPPVPAIDRKLEAVCRSENSLDTSTVYQAEVNIAKELIDTASSFELKNANRVFVIKQAIVDSIRLDYLKAVLGPQELSVLSSQNMHVTGDKFIRSVDFELSASTAPYYLNDTVYLNPFFNGVHINKVHFRKCAFLTKLKPLVRLLNTVLDNYMDNVNGRLQNYYVVVKALPEGGMKVSDMLSKEPDVTVVNDATVNWTGRDLTGTVFIDNKSLDLLLLDRAQIPQQTNFVCGDFAKLSMNGKLELFNTLYRTLKDKYEYASAKSFDTSDNGQKFLARLRLSNQYLQENLNYGFDNLNFRFNYPIGFRQDGIYSDVTIHKPEFSCFCSGFCDRIITGNGLGQKIKRAACKLACIGTGGLNPIVGTYMAACEGGQLLWPENYTIGSVSGSVDAGGTLNGNLKKISFSESLSKVTVSKDLSAQGNLNYGFKFTSLNHFSIGRFLFTMATQCVQMDLSGNPAVSATIGDDFHVAITKEQDGDKSKLKILILPFVAHVNLDKSPGMEIVTNFANRFTCGIGYDAFGISLLLSQIVPQSIIPEKFANYFDAVTMGKYDHMFELKAFMLPLDFKTKTAFGDINTATHWGTKSINAVANFKDAK